MLICCQDFPINEVLSGGYLFDTYDADLIQSVLDRLTPQTARYSGSPKLRRRSSMRVALFAVALHVPSLCSVCANYYALTRRRGGAFWNIAIRPSVCPMVQLPRLQACWLPAA